MPIDVSLSTQLCRWISQSLLVALLVLPSSFASAQGRSRSDQTVSVGPWEISTAYRADKFENCTMSRTFESLDVTFVRGSDGLSLVLSDPKWRLERGQSYPVHLNGRGRGKKRNYCSARSTTRAHPTSCECAGSA